MLQSFLYRAVRIVVDTGMHWKGWSRERAVDYMEAHRRARARLPSRARSIATACGPARPAATRSATLEFVRLRAAAQAKLGARFDLRGFHDAVLKGGAMPLEVLARVVDDWMRSV